MSLYLVIFVIYCNLLSCLSYSNRFSHVSAKILQQTSLQATNEPTPSQVISHYEEITVPTLKGIYFADITPTIRDAVGKLGVKSGQVAVLSRHTTTSISINEMESRLVDDARQFLLKLAPPLHPYLHNDLHLRNGPPNWPGGDEAWRAQEPINAHSIPLRYQLDLCSLRPKRASYIHRQSISHSLWLHQSLSNVSYVMDHHKGNSQN